MVNKKSHTHYKVLAVFGVDEIVSHINPGVRKSFVVSGEKYNVNCGSIRLRTFKQSLVCVTCGLVGSAFLLEMTSANIRNNESPHLNLYGVNEAGEYVMMTKDHILPKSRGGKDELTNLQTMCYVCNEEKGNNVTSSLGCSGSDQLETSISKT